MLRFDVVNLGDLAEFRGFGAAIFRSGMRFAELLRFGAVSVRF